MENEHIMAKRMWNYLKWALENHLAPSNIRTRQNSYRLRVTGQAMYV